MRATFHKTSCRPRSCRSSQLRASKVFPGDGGGRIVALVPLQNNGNFHRSGPTEPDISTFPFCNIGVTAPAPSGPRTLLSRHPPDPTPEELAALPAHMRRWYWFADFVNRRLKFLSAGWIHTTMRALLWCTAGNRMKVHGTEHVAGITKASRVLMVANHRSFFDFYVVAFANVRHTRLAQRAFFPVRAEFFYEGLLGTTINWWMTILAMFPPILRDPKRRAWNRYALKRLEAELTIPGTWVGIHPEGRRNKDAGPYTFLKPHAGTGQIALAVGEVQVVPLYVVGISNHILRETMYNWWRPQDHRIDVWFGPPVDLSALRAELVTGEVPPRALSVAASQKCMESIVALAEKHRQLYDPDHPEVQPPWEIDTSEGARERVAPEDADGRRQP